MQARGQDSRAALSAPDTPRPRRPRIERRFRDPSSRPAGSKHSRANDERTLGFTQTNELVGDAQRIWISRCRRPRAGLPADPRSRGEPARSTRYSGRPGLGSWFLAQSDRCRRSNARRLLARRARHLGKIASGLILGGEMPALDTECGRESSRPSCRPFSRSALVSTRSGRYEPVPMILQNASRLTHVGHLGSAQCTKRTRPSAIRSRRGRVEPRAVRARRR